MEEKLRVTLENLKAFGTISTDGENDVPENTDDGLKSDLGKKSENAETSEKETLEPISRKPTITPLNIGIVSDPPTLVLSYLSILSIKGIEDQKTFRKRKMPLRQFDDKTDVVKFAFGLKQRHHDYLHSVPSVIIEKLLRISQETQKGLPVHEAVKKIDDEYNIDPNEDLNKLSVNELLRKKQLMEESYHKNAIKPGDELYVYDKQVNFEEKTATANYSAWDEDEENEIDTDAGESGDKANKVSKELSDTVEVEDSAVLQRSELYEVNNSDESSHTHEDNEEQYIPMSSIFSDKIELRDKSLFEKPDPIKLDELDSIGVRDIEIEAANYEEALDDDEFW